MAAIPLIEAAVAATKKALADRMPDVRSSHLSEALAAALGRRTHASLRAELASHRDDPLIERLNDESFQSRLDELGYQVDPRFSFELLKAPYIIRPSDADFGRTERQRQARFRENLSEPTDLIGHRHGHLLALGREEENLIPSLRGNDGACRFFKDRGIRWWQAGTNGDDSGGMRPTRNMVSSQVACVNFVRPLASIRHGLTAMLQAVDDDVIDVVQIEEGGTKSPVEFEWIGLGHALEGPGVTSRGANSTSVDAFLIARTPAGRRAYLLEWKYVEKYASKNLGEGSSGETRRLRYAQLYRESPSFNGKAPFDAWLFEPLYQVLRLRLLADRMVRNREFGVSDAKVVVVVPEGNRAYRDRVTSPWFATAFPNLTLSDIVRETLVHPDGAYASVSQSTLADAVRQHCGDAAASWGTYHRERYGW